MPEAVPISVVETPEFLTAAGPIMDDREPRGAGRPFGLASDQRKPGPGTGGVRKLRWSLPGRGKRGGARVIYFFHSSDPPLFVLTAYAKSARADLSQADRNSFRRLTRLLVASYGGGSRRERR